MGKWALIQVVFDIFAALGLFVVIMRMNRAPKDDPRMSRGLQLLQSKISVIEDLSDRTEIQVNQLTAILEQKSREVQAKVQLAEQHVQMIKVSMENSLEVAKIFQDKIPHQEIIERQNTVKYVQAARLAHQGLSVDEIATQVDLPKGEIEFIVKVNRDRLVFSEEQLPSWAKEGAAADANPDIYANTSSSESDFHAAAAGIASAHEQGGRLRAEMELAEHQRLVENLSRLQSEMQNLDIQLAKDAPVRDLAAAFEVPQIPTNSLQKLGEEFRKACEEADQAASRNPLFPPLEQLSSFMPQTFSGESQASSSATSPATMAQATGPGFMHVPTAPSMPAAPAPAVAPVAQDPVLARAVAQAKVQNALRASALPKPQTEASPDLVAARAIAKEIAREPSLAVPTHAPLASAIEVPQQRQSPAGASTTAAPAPITHVIGGRSTKGTPDVRVVQFPRISSET